MIKYALHNNDYLDVAQHYHKIWETPSVKEDESGKGQTVSPMILLIQLTVKLIIYRF